MKAARTLLLAVLATALPAWGQAYKCRMPDGSTQISSSPCADGGTTVKTVEEEEVSDAARRKAEQEAERLRQKADSMEAERKADEAQERRDAEADRKAAGLPSPASIQQCLNAVGRMNIDASRRAELESGCQLTGKVQQVYTETYQPPYYYGGGYYPGYPRPPRPVHPIAPLPAPGAPSMRPPPKPVDLYKVPSPPAVRR